jgi:filamentous hemagglutinin family protein
MQISLIRHRLFTGCATAALVIAVPALAQELALPLGGQVVAGTASVGLPQGMQLTVEQSSAKAVIDWTSFSIGAGGTVQFNNGTGATLNRVLGSDPSTIAGQLRATGSVFLINPAGIVVDATGRVMTGGSFVASTRALDTAGFMAGGEHSFVGASQRGVENRGEISAGGDAILIGHIADNSGSLSAGDTAGLATGTTVVLREASADGRIYVAGGGGDATNTGSIAAASAELRAAQGNVYALAGSTGIVRATGSA